MRPFDEVFEMWDGCVLDFSGRTFVGFFNGEDSVSV